MHEGEAPGGGEPEPGASPARPLLLRLLVLLEEERPLLRANPRPRVSHAERREAPFVSDVDDDFAGLRELDRVAHEVGHHLPDALRVGARVDQRLSLEAHCDRPRADETHRLAHDVPRDGGEIDLRPGELELPALERAQLEDVVDEIEQVLA